MDTTNTQAVHPLLEGTTPEPWSWRHGDDLRTLHNKGEYQYGAQVLRIGSDVDGAPELVMSEPDRELIAAAPTLASENAKMRAALEKLVRINEEHNEAIAKVMGKPLGWKDDYLNEAREVLASLTI